MQKPGLFGLNRSNRDFTKEKSWGKNQFNSSFPAALACYMSGKDIGAIYLKLDCNLKVIHSSISIEQLFGLPTDSENLFFAFEHDFVPYRELVIGKLPRIDLVTQDVNRQICLRGLEIKLTALPDNSTCELPDEQFGTELVIRPDSIVYLALSIAVNYRHNIDELKSFIGNTFDAIEDWREGQNVMPYLTQMIETLDKILRCNCNLQIPLIMQPIWKTIGKTPQLADNCLDIFVWSNLAFTRLFLNVATTELTHEKQITRPLRSIIWLMKMLLDFCKHGKIDHAKIIKLSYNSSRDNKAFAASGKKTHPFMSCAELTNPRIAKHEIKNIIQGDGQLLLSPERRFDAIVYNSPDLFE